MFSVTVTAFVSDKKKDVVVLSIHYAMLMQPLLIQHHLKLTKVLLQALAKLEKNGKEKQLHNPYNLYLNLHFLTV